MQDAGCLLTETYDKYFLSALSATYILLPATFITFWCLFRFSNHGRGQMEGEPFEVSMIKLIDRNYATDQNFKYFLIIVQMCFLIQFET